MNSPKSSSAVPQSQPQTTRTTTRRRLPPTPEGHRVKSIGPNNNQRRMAPKTPPSTGTNSEPPNASVALHVVTPQQPTLPSYATSVKEAAPKQRLPSTIPASVTNNTNPRKIVYLIRHGESLGQAAPTQQRRRTDPALVDCGLSPRGIEQAKALSTLNLNVDLVLSSPLTRALQTAVLAFPNIPQIAVDYNLREIGTSTIPENQPRDMKSVLQDLPPHPNTVIDIQTHAPKFPWPQHHDRIPNVLRRNQVKCIFRSLATLPYCNVVAVVCHWHVIRAALMNAKGFLPVPNLNLPNAVPLPCYLTPEGQLVLACT